MSDADVSLVRNDPEAVVTEGGVFIYYTQRGSSVVYRADTGLGLPEALTLIGTGNDDELLGNAAADVITGENGDDILRGAAGSDTITGGAGNDILIGDVGDDLLNGAGYNDQGINTIDTLTGGKGTDTFILGDTNSVFYSANGRRDYALITDFNLTEDLIQLKGSLEYSATNRKNGSLLFLVDSGEEIAFLQNIRAGDLNPSNFILV